MDYLLTPEEIKEIKLSDFPTDKDGLCGKQVFNGTDLEMVMEKFDRAVSELEKMK